MQLHIPALKPTPSPLMDVLPRQGGASPTKSHPYSAQDYTKPTVGDVLQWPFPERTDSPGKTEGRRSEPLEGATLEALHLPRPDSKSQDHPSSVLEHNNYCPLQPRFYSPKHLAAYGFREGETPSKNVSELLFLPLAFTGSGAPLPHHSPVDSSSPSPLPPRFLMTYYFIGKY